MREGGGASADFREVHHLGRNLVVCGAGTGWLEPPVVGRVVVIPTGCVRGADAGDGRSHRL
jgi:hypothetical protein